MPQSNDHFLDQVVGWTCQRSPCRVICRTKEKGKFYCVGKGNSPQPFPSPAQSRSPVLSIRCLPVFHPFSHHQVSICSASHQRLTCTIPATYMYSLLPSISSLLMHPSTASIVLSQESPSSRNSLFFHLHWLLSRCYVYKASASDRIHMFELTWSVITCFGFQWLSASLNVHICIHKQPGICSRQGTYRRREARFLTHQDEQH